MEILIIRNYIDNKGLVISDLYEENLVYIYDQ